MSSEYDRPFCCHRHLNNTFRNIRINNAVLDVALRPFHKVNCCTRGHRACTSRQMRKKRYKHNTGIDNSGYGARTTSGTSEVRGSCGGPLRCIGGGSGFTISCSGAQRNISRLLGRSGGVAMVNLLWSLLLLASFAFVPVTCQSIMVTVYPDTVQVTEGSSATLYCNYTMPSIVSSLDQALNQDLDQDLEPEQSNQEQTVTWLKDGVILRSYTGNLAIVSQSGGRVSLVAPASLRISRVVDEDSGSYTCKIEQRGLVGSASATLNVQGRLPVLLGHEGHSEASFLAGETLRLQCKGSYPLYWTYHTGIDHSKISIRSTLTPIPESSSWNESSVLVINNATASDSGYFTCSHTHDSHDFSREIYVYINATDANSLFLPSDITNITLYALDPFVLPCRVSISSFDVNIILANGDAVPQNELPSYNDRVGFSVSGEDADKYEGSVACVAVFDGSQVEQTYLVQIIRKPIIVNSTQDVTIPEYTTLTLVCEGALPLIWVHELPDMEIDILISTLRRPNGDLYYRSILNIESATYGNTGYFSCFYLRYINANDVSLRTSVYVFVSSYDADRIFLPKYALQSIDYNKATPMTVPCRISNPNLDVTFEVYFKDTGTEFTNFYWTHTYDKKVGFTLTPTIQTIDGIALIFTCYSTVVNGNQSDTNSGINVASISMFLGDTEKPILNLELRQDKEEVIANKEGFELSCRAFIPFSLLFLSNAQDYIPRFAWVGPGGTRPENVLELEPDPNSNEIDYEAGFTYYKTKLVGNASVDDNGIYTCYAANIGAEAEETISVQVHARGYADISHRFNVSDPTTNLTAIVNHDKCISFDVPAYPPPKFRVSPPRNWVLTMNESSKVLTMCSSNVSEAHEGDYTMYVWNDYQNASITFFFTVQVPPRSSITINPAPVTLFNSSIKGFVMGMTYTLECKSTGKPKPMVYWLFQRCPTDPSVDPDCVASDRWEKVQVATMSSVEYSSDDSIATLIVEAQEWTLYRCTVWSASEFFQDVHQDVDFKILDSETGVRISTDSDLAFIGDDLTLECHATAFFFTEIKWFFVNPNGTDRWLNSSTPKYSSYSLVSTLRVSNITGNDAGSYVCVAISGDNPDWEKNTTQVIDVREVSEPEIIRSSDDPIAISLDRMKENLRIQCLARGLPRPSLSLYFTQADPILLEDAVVGGNASVVWLNYDVVRPSLAMSGSYECVAVSRGGEVRQTYQVSITEFPELKIGILSSAVKVGDNVTISCLVVRGFPIPMVQLKKENVPVSLSQGIGNISYTLTAQVSDGGKYYCEALDANSTSEFIELVIDKAPPGNLQKIMPYLLSSLCLIILIILLYFVWKCRRRPKVRRASRLPPMEMPRLGSNRRSIYSVSDDPYENMAYNQRWEFPRERLKLGGIIGKGAFGLVIKAVAVGIDGTEKNITVAVKRLKSGASSQEKKALWAELKMLGHIGKHLNVVNFLGACTQNGPVLAIVEFCCRGNLLDFVRSKRKYFTETPEGTGSQSHTGHSSSTGTSSNFQTSSGSERRMKAVYDQVIPEELASALQDDPIDGQDLLCYSFQVARGMEFLASKKVIHRDLAARNVLVTENYTAKICDFGLAKHLYDDPDYVASGKQGRLPIKWMAPESIFDKVFTTYSDVWAYAVFLWEVFSLGGSPYPGIQIDEQFYNKIKNGYRMNAPDYAPTGVYDTMLECWTPDPEARPSFSILAVRLGDMLEANVRSEYIELNMPYEDVNHTVSNELPSPHEDTPLLGPNPPPAFKPTPVNSAPNTPPSPTRMVRSDASDSSQDVSRVPDLSPPVRGPEARPFLPKDDAQKKTTVQEVNELEEGRNTPEDDVFLTTEVTTNGLKGFTVNAQNTWL